jgi:hypothetical protein
MIRIKIMIRSWKPRPKTSMRPFSGPLDKFASHPGGFALLQVACTWNITG